MNCSSCKFFFQRKPKHGPVNPAQLGFCVCQMPRPGMKRGFRQPAAWDGQQGQWPFQEKRCRNWEEKDDK